MYVYSSPSLSGMHGADDCNEAEAAERRITYVVYDINCHPLSNPGPTVHPV